MTRTIRLMLCNSLMTVRASDTQLRTNLTAAPTIVSSILPSSGPSTGNSIITVTGQFFLGVDTTCKFGSVKSTENTFVSSTQLLCTSPPQSPGLYAVDVTNNNQDYTDWEVNFEYFGVS